MKKKKPIQPQDKYVLRLPDGLRDRIKRYAEMHSRSMNAEIVRILEREFPPPASIEDKVSELLRLVEMLREGRTADFFGRFSSELISTLVDVSNGRIKVDDETRQQVEAALMAWQEERQENDYYRYTGSMDDEEAEQFDRTGRPSKYVDPEFPFDDDKK